MSEVTKAISMDDKWTDDQRLAINTTDRGVVVSAAAGSGKTAVLIERTIRLLADREKQIPADSLLAVTFTVDATAQMKDKLASAFEKSIIAEESPDQKKWLQKQQDRLAMAKITTINAFCLELVKTNIHEFELQGGIKILDEIDAKVILQKALTQAMEELSLTSPNDLEFLVETLSDNNEGKVEETVEELYYFLRSLPFPDVWISSVQDSFTSDDKLSNYINTVLYDINERLDNAFKMNEYAKSIFYDIHDKFSASEKMGAWLNDDESNLKSLAKTINNGSWEEIYSAFENIKWCKKPAAYAKTQLNDYSPFDQELAKSSEKQITNIRDSYKNDIKAISDSLGEIGKNIREDLLTAQRMFTLLCHLCKAVECLAWEEKVSKNSLEFSDVERMAIKLLVDFKDGGIVRTPLAEELVKNRDYRVILIDEFQDVNNLQELVFKALSDTDDLSFLGKNVFVVGDVKQSIYRFRQSNPQLFINAKINARDDRNSQVLKSVELKKNFRSRQNIIDFVNFIFENLMSEEIGEVVYTGSELLQLGAQYSGENPDTEILLVRPESNSSDNNNDEENSEDEDEFTLFTHENYIIAKRIRQLIDEQYPVCENGQQRPCRPSDFCVLSRNKKVTAKMSAALESVGLKAYNEETSGYLRAREIAVMTNLLRVIDNPMQDMPFVSVMMSSLMSFSAQDVALLRHYCKDEEGKTKRFYQVLNSIAQTDDAHEKQAKKIYIYDDVLEKKCADAITLVKRLRFYASTMPLSKLIRKIYDETGFFAVASAYENSRQKRANLRLLLEYAATYESSGEGGVSGFCRYLDSVSASGKDFKQAVTVTEGGDSVFVKTIHSSKGLEYPFIFMCGIHKAFNLLDLSGRMLLDENIGVGFNILNHENLTKTETVSHKALKIIGKNKALSEEIRLLYVAFTRAKEKIFIPIMIQESEKAIYDTREQIKALAVKIAQAGGINPRIVRSCKSYLHWICAVLLCYPNNKEFLKEMDIQVELPQLETSAEITFTVVDDSAGMKVAKPQYKNVSSNEKLVSQLVKKYNYNYNIQSAITPAKLTVTEIVRDEKEREYGDKNPEFFPQLPKLSDELGKLSAAQKGTYTHLFMEVANYDNAAKSVSAELKRLVEDGYLTKKEAGGVYVEAVENFFKGDFYKRMSQSDEIIREKQFLVSFADLKLGDKYSEYVQSGSMLQGIADCLFKEGDSYVLVDYKTDNFTDISQLYTYKTQLELYKAALDLALGIPISICYIFSFKLNEGVEINLID